MEEGALRNLLIVTIGFARVLRLRDRPSSDARQIADMAIDLTLSLLAAITCCNISSCHAQRAPVSATTHCSTAALKGTDASGAAHVAVQKDLGVRGARLKAMGNESPTRSLSQQLDGSDSEPSSPAGSDAYVAISGKRLLMCFSHMRYVSRVHLH
jgi:hypothetical protein